MAFYRSELEVPVNKTHSELRNSNDENDYIKRSFSKTSPALDFWAEKVKFHLQNERDSFNSIQDNLLQDFSTGRLFPLYEKKEMESFSSVDMFQQLQSKIAKGPDGNMHFSARFDVKNVDPESIKVFVKEGSMVISVEHKEVHSPKISSSREYTKKFNLPPLIILDSITCALSSDSILCLDGVLESSFNSKNNSTSNVSTFSHSNSQNLLASSSIISSKCEEKYRANIAVGFGYDPQDISIKTRDDKLFINARHEEKSETRTNYREFSKELTLPDKVDTLSISVIFNNGILYIEAPYIN